MSTWRLFALVVGLLAAYVVHDSAAFAIPQSPILFDKLNEKHRNHVPKAVTPQSFKYPTNVTLEVGREKKERRGGQPPIEFHDKVTIKAIKKPAAMVAPTLQLAVDGVVKEFNFDHFHFHRTAEHLWSPNLNHLYGMELHLVHKRDTGMKDMDNMPIYEYAAVGRWIDVAVDPVVVGPPDPNYGHNADLAKLFDAYAAFGPIAFDPVDLNDPKKKKIDKHTESVKDFNLQKFLPGPDDFEYYRYQGSLTTTDKQGPAADLKVWNNILGPPVVAANENWVSAVPVSWVMFEESLTVSRNQLDQYSAFINNIDNHFAAQYEVPLFNYNFAVWDRTNAHKLQFVRVPEPGTGALLVIAGVASTRLRRCRGREV
jgi:carbonic anhydrase